MCSYAQNEDIVGIVLEEGKSDALVIGDKTIKKASVYGKKEDVLQFLINDKYIHHRMDDAVNYHFPLVRSTGKEESKAKSDKKIYIRVHNDEEFKKIYSKLNRDKNPHNSFRLHSINDIDIIVTRKDIDTNDFKTNLDIVKLLLQKDKTDVLKIANQEISEVTIYGTKDDLIHFLINEKYIVHRNAVGHGSEYKFTQANEMSEQIKNLECKNNTISKRILIIIDNPNEYESIIERNSIPGICYSNKSLIHLDKINNLNIFVTSSIKN